MTPRNRAPWRSSPTRPFQSNASRPLPSRIPQVHRLRAPYTQLPDFYWSGGSYAPGQDPATHPVNAVPVALDAASLDQLAQAGFCAVTYSVAQAQLAQAQDVEIEGRDLAQDLPTPSWQDDTYKVWLLPTP